MYTINFSGVNVKKHGLSAYHEIDMKIAQAHEAFLPWASLTMCERIEFLNLVYQELVERKSEIRSIIVEEVGIPVSLCDQIDINPALNYLQGYLHNAEKWLASEVVFEDLDEIHYLHYEPRGVVGVSIPWNYPLTGFVWGVIQNLIAGNTVVFKHSNKCTRISNLLGEVLMNHLPKGVCSVVYGAGDDVGEYLMNNNLDLICFTGSTFVGRHLNQVAAQKFIPAILELGGSAAGIVFEDADLGMTVESIYNYRFLNSGQSCDGLKRLLVDSRIFDEVVERLYTLIASKKVGCANDPLTDIGPLVTEYQVKKLKKQVEDAVNKGAIVIADASCLKNQAGLFCKPTILTNITCDMKVWREETFGPVLPIIPFFTEEEAVCLANDSMYGLGGYVYTQDKERALRVSRLLQTGNVSINNANYVIPQDPFGGCKQSGLGREHGRYGLRELTSLKVVALKK